VVLLRVPDHRQRLWQRRDHRLVMNLVSPGRPFQRGTSANEHLQAALSGHACDARDFNLAGLLIVRFQTIKASQFQRLVMRRVNPQIARPPRLRVELLVVDSSLQVPEHHPTYQQPPSNPAHDALPQKERRSEKLTNQTPRMKTTLWSRAPAKRK